MTQFGLQSLISGYLMSRIIFTSINKNEFSFLDYYAKRLKRIAPALLFLVIILSIVCFFFYLPEEYKRNQKNAAASLLFLSNFLYWKSSNYFDAASDTNILLHTWSLSVEWQFYLIYPVILLVMNKVFKNKSVYFIFFTGTTVAIFIVSVIATIKEPTASFYLFPTRSWEMLFGGVAFFSEGFVKDNKWRKALSIVGYATIFACFLLLNTSMLWPGMYTMIPVLATYLVIVANYNDFGIIKHQIIQFIGKISYSLYLWHWPIFVIAMYFGVSVNVQSVILFTALATTLAYLSFKYVESLEIRNSQSIIAVATVCIIATSALSYFNTNHTLFKDKTLEIADYSKNHPHDTKNRLAAGNCFVSSGKSSKEYNKKECLCIEKNKKNVLLIGDSHAAHLFVSLEESLSKNGINLLKAAESGDLPTVENNHNGRNRDIINFVYHDFIKNNADKIDGVIISAVWSKDDSNTPEQVLGYIKKTIDYCNKYNIKVMIIGESETYNIPYPSIAAKEYEYESEESEKYLISSSYTFDNYLSENLKPYYVRIINMDSFPPLSKENTPYMFDENHFTKYGADLAINKILSDPISRSFFGLGNGNVLATN
ncbi:acyltransferase [Dyadobacter flavalbus]|uniref:Acyltransferase n=1 Tax=Dyadobacter flavalbus TaxID=2579942 RepID=A0A5M8QRS0_9BACT|nr:acyltransferase family protein [Dyadobacter flavalbus]KAA6438957.1 acyltransferase [Dyadobacter flavalbus]